MREGMLSAENVSRLFIMPAAESEQILHHQAVSLVVMKSLQQAEGAALFSLILPVAQPSEDISIPEAVINGNPVSMTRRHFNQTEPDIIRIILPLFFSQGLSEQLII